MIAAARDQTVCRQCNRRLSDPRSNDAGHLNHSSSQLYLQTEERKTAAQNLHEPARRSTATRLFTKVGEGGEEEWPDLPCTVDPQRSVDSLDQLFAQAACLHPVLREKVRVWALASGGLFPTTDHPPRFVPLAASGPGSGPAPDVKFAKLKSVSRAIEKVGYPASPALLKMLNGEINESTYI